MKDNIPKICKIRNKLADYGFIRRSPSASLFCKWGFRYGAYDKCEKCDRKSSIFTFLIPPTIKNKK